MSSRTLIRGGTVLTLGARTSNHAEADVLVDGDRIVEIGQNLRARDAEVVEAAGSIVMPGFVDAHRHTWKSLFRNMGLIGSSDRSVVPSASVGRHFDADDLYAATLIGLLGAVESGITTVVDWCDMPLDNEFTEAALQAHTDVGLRCVYVPVRPRWSEERGFPEAVRRVVAERAAASNPMRSIAFGAEDPEDPDLTARDWGTARELGLRIHAHVGTDDSHAGAVAAIGDRGLLGEDVTLVHCTRLSAGDLDAISGSGTSVVLTPPTEMAGGIGAPPVQALIDRSIRPGLGVDDERIAPGDMFAQMRAAISVQHATLFDLKLAGKGGVPNLMSTRDAIRHGTIDGANAIGLGAITGSLEPGKQADIVVLRSDHPNIFPINDPIGAVVWGMDTSNIEWVFAGGRAVLRSGEIEADTGRARRLAGEAQRRVASAAGIVVGPEVVRSA